MQNKIVLLGLCILCLLCKQNSEKKFSEISSEIAQHAKAELGKNLMNAIKEKGTLGAIEFCNVNAIPITKSLAEKYNVHLKRVSDKPRNPSNSINEDELKVIKIFKMQLVNSEKLQPVITKTETSEIGFYPIETNAMCLQCHGDKEITKEVSVKLKSIYPEDKAVGYFTNQIRGMWVIEKK